MYGIIDKATQRGMVIKPHKMTTELVTCVAVASLVTLAFFNRGEATIPAPVASNPPTLDLRSGKILDRVAGEMAATAFSGEKTRAPVNSAIHFAYGLDVTDDAPTIASAEPQDVVPTTMKVTAREMTKQANGTSRTKQRPANGATTSSTPRVMAGVASATPVPPPRPAPVAAPTTVVAQGAEPEEPTSLLGRVLPPKLLPSGREAWNKVASLGEALVDRLVP